MDKLCGCANCTCQQKCNCMQTTVKTQMILYVREKERKNEKNRQLANKPKYINVKSNIKRDHVKQPQIKSIAQKSVLISPASFDLRQTKNQFTHSNNTSIFSRNMQNYNPNSSLGYNKTGFKTPKTNIKSHKMSMTPNLSEMLQLRLIDQDNQHLKKELARLKLEQKQLLTLQKQMQNKLSYEIKSLISSSEEMKQRSAQRRKQIKELQEMLQWKRQNQVHTVFEKFSKETQ